MKKMCLWLKIKLIIGLYVPWILSQLQYSLHASYMGRVLLPGLRCMSCFAGLIKIWKQNDWWSDCLGKRRFFDVKFASLLVSEVE
ncbi:MAG: hypothetical protein ACJAVI_002349 [Candidatus Azotimanducaceae bacterium]|jgi:hypothetical protein